MAKKHSFKVKGTSKMHEEHKKGKKGRKRGGKKRR